MADQDIKRRN